MKGPWMIIISGALFTFWLTFELFYEEELLTSGHQFIKYMQTNYEGEWVLFFSNFLNYFITLTPLVILIVTLHLRISKMDAFYTMGQVIFTLVAASALKIVLQCSRPYLMFDDIKAKACECSFSSPSFHSTLSTISMLCFFNDLKAICKGMGITYPKKPILVFLKVIGFVLVCVEGLIRMYVGVHNYTEIVVGALLALFMFFLMDNHRIQIRGYLFERYDRVRKNKFSQICSLIFPIIFFLIAFGINHWLRKQPTRPLTPQEIKNLSKCPICKHGMIKTASVGLLSFYYVPGMMLCFSIMSCQKSSNKKRNFTLSRKAARLILVTCFRLVFVLPLIFVYKYRFNNSTTMNFFLSVLLMLAPSVGFGFPGMFLKKCQLEIRSDFIQKKEDPREDTENVVVSDFLANNGSTVEWSVSKIYEFEDHLLSGNSSQVVDLEDQNSPQSLPTHDSSDLYNEIE